MEKLIIQMCLVMALLYCLYSYLRRCRVRNNEASDLECRM